MALGGAAWTLDAAFAPGLRAPDPACVGSNRLRDFGIQERLARPFFIVPKWGPVHGLEG
jgi:hypothetical protein